MSTSSSSAPASTSSGRFDPDSFDPFAPDQLENPYPIYAQARRDRPVFYSSRFGMWVVTRYDDICTVVKYPDRFSSVGALTADTTLPPAVEEILATGYRELLSLVESDPPNHTRMRNIVGKALTPQRIAALEPQIRGLANELIGGFIHDGQADLVTQFGFLLPGLTVCDLLGVPRTDMPQLRRWSADRQLLLLVNALEEQLIAGAHGLVALQHYFRAHLEQRARQPQDDLLTLLVPSEIGGSAPLSMQEAVSEAIELLIAGHETTTDLISCGLDLLLAHPEQLALLRDDPSLIPAAIEEMLRMEAPVRGLFRTTTDEVELGGTRLPQNAHLLLLYASANRDETQFAAADSFDISRKDASKHLAFSKGIHFCLGSALARLEGRIAFEVLLQRLPGLRRQPDQPTVRRLSLVLRGFEHYPIAWDVPPV